MCLLCSQPSEPPPHLVRLYLWEWPGLNRHNHYSLKTFVVSAVWWLLWSCAFSIGIRRNCNVSRPRLRRPGQWRVSCPMPHVVYLQALRAPFHRGFVASGITSNHPPHSFVTSTPSASAIDSSNSREHFSPRSTSRIFPGVTPTARDSCHCVKPRSCRMRRMLFPTGIMVIPPCSVRYISFGALISRG